MSIKVFLAKLTGRYLWGHLVAMFVVLVVLAFGVKIGLGIYTHHGESVELPDLTGVDFQRAVAMLDEQGLVINVTDSGHNKKMPANSILSQMPGPGTHVKQGRTIFVTINSSTLPTVKIPDLIDNSSFREAQARLTSLGFRMMEPKRIDGERDWVYGIMRGSRQVETGEMIPIESELTLVIGNGYDEDEEDMDDLMADSTAMGMDDGSMSIDDAELLGE